jgi:hypothetical protein
MLSRSSETTFEFESWLALAQADPPEFERRRRHAVERVIESARAPARLRGLQFRIDMERRRSRTPYKSCLRLYQMMWDSFTDLDDMLNWYTRAGPSSSGRTGPVRGPAKIIPFRKH